MLFKIRPVSSVNYLAYISTLPFVLPIIYSVFGSDFYLIGFSYIPYCLIIVLYLSIKFDHTSFNYPSFEYTKDTYKSFSNAALIIFFVSTLISFSYTCISTYLSFYVPARDPGIFFGMIQSIVKGDLAYSSVAGIYHFATHQNYILVLLVPLYLLFKTPIIIQLSGGIAIWAAGIMLWKISRLYFNQLISLCAVISFYITPLNYIYSFRPELFYPLAIFGLFYVAITQKKSWVVILVTLFLLSIKEDAILYIPGYLLIFLQQKRYRLFIFITLITMITFYANSSIVQPFFVLKSHLNKSGVLEFYSLWGNSKYTILINMLSHPIRVIKIVFNANSGIWYIYGLWLFLASPFSLVAGILPIILYTTSNNLHMHILNEYYPIALNALGYIGVINTSYIIKNKFKTISNYIPKLLSIFLLIHPLMFIDITNIVTIKQLSLHHGRWQEFHKINFYNLRDFASMRNDVQLHYANQNICPSNQIYPHMDSLDFNRLQPFGWANLNQKNCINIFSTTGDTWPITPNSFILQTKLMLSTGKCKQFGKFYYCNNLNQ